MTISSPSSARGSGKAWGTHQRSCGMGVPSGVDSLYVQKKRSTVSFDAGVRPQIWMEWRSNQKSAGRGT